jgi:hypothetical protein
VVWIFFPEMGLNEESEVSFWKEKMGLSVDREDLGYVLLKKHERYLIKTLLLSIISVFAISSYAQSDSTIYLRTGGIQRRNAEGPKIVLKCSDKRCTTLQFAELQNKKLTLLSTRDYTQTELEVAIESLIQAVNSPEPITMEYTRRYYMYLFNETLDSSGPLALLLAIPPGIVGLQVDVVYGTPKNIVGYWIQSQSERKINNAYLKNKSYIISSDDYDDMKAIISSRF